MYGVRIRDSHYAVELSVVMGTVPLHRVRSTGLRYGVASISRLLKIVCLFGTRAL